MSQVISLNSFNFIRIKEGQLILKISFAGYCFNFIDYRDIEKKLTDRILHIKINLT